MCDRGARVSYILEALRKAEKDRNLGKTPTLGDVTTPISRPAEDRGLSRRTLALIVLVLVLALLAVGIWPRREAVPASAAVIAAPSVAAPSASTAPVAADRLEPAAELEIALEEPALDEAVVADTLDDLLDDSTGAASQQDEATSPRVDPLAEASDGQGDSEGRADEPTVELASASGAPAPSSGDAVASQFPLLRDMPSDYRAGFPALRMEVHVYDADPARRWAMINGKKAVESSTLAEGPRVVEITAEGLILDYRGRSTLFPLKR